MIPFDELKNQWQKQQAPEMELTLKEMASKINNRQKKLVVSNLIVSVAFALVFIVMGWIWSSFPDRSPAFYISLVLMSALLLAALSGLWAGVHFRNHDPDVNSRAFIQKSRKKIQIQLLMLKNGLPVYFILLYSFFCVYFFDLFKDAEPLLTIGAYVALTLFLGLMYILSLKKRRYNIESALNVINELREIELNLD